MKNQYFKKLENWTYINIIIFILIIDIYSKFWIINNIKIYETHKIFSMLNFFHIHNYGIAFSLFSNQSGWQRWFLSSINTFTILAIIRIIIKSKKEKKKIVGYCLIISGAIGNLIDRIFYGSVIDFIDIHINNFHFATFNIADCSIFIGILIFIKTNF